MESQRDLFRYVCMYICRKRRRGEGRSWILIGVNTTINVKRGSSWNRKERIGIVAEEKNSDRKGTE